MKRLSDINFALISTHRLLANALQLRCEDLARNGKFEELESAQNQLTIVSKALGETLGPEYTAMQKLCRAIRHAAQDEIDAAILSFGQASVEESVSRLRETAKQQIVRAITYRVDKAIQIGNTTLASQEIERATQWDPEIQIPNRLLLLPLEDAFAKFKREATPTSIDEFRNC